MNHAVGFPPIAAADARVLILGSMPGVASLKASHYYAHPRNSFWPIVSALLKRPQLVDGSYRERCELLKQHRIALWDVLQSCVRSGSLDSAIREESIVPNDLIAFLREHPAITDIFFNGRKAEESFRHYLLADVKEAFGAIDYHLLPSTSPAMASLSLKEKLKRWRIVAECLDAN